MILWNRLIFGLSLELNFHPISRAMMVLRHPNYVTMLRICESRRDFVQAVTSPKRTLLRPIFSDRALYSVPLREAVSLRVMLLRTHCGQGQFRTLGVSE